MNDWQQICYWNKNSYGKAVKIPRLVLALPLIVFCIVTPLTNWILPIAYRKLPSYLRVRY